MSGTAYIQTDTVYAHVQCIIIIICTLYVRTYTYVYNYMYKYITVL